MSSDAKEILDQSVDAQKSLRLLSRFEPAHLLFSLSGVLMRDFRAIVSVTARVVSNMRQHRSKRSPVTL